MLKWQERKVNDIKTNPLECYWAIGSVGIYPRLYRIIEQYPVKEDGYTVVSKSKPELYLLFEELGGRAVADVFTTEKELEEWKHARIWGNYWFKGNGSFIHAYKTLDEAKARAEVQIEKIQELSNEYFPTSKNE